MLHVLSAKMHDIRQRERGVKERERKKVLWTKNGKIDDVVEWNLSVASTNCNEKQRYWTEEEEDKTHEMKLSV